MNLELVIPYLPVIIAAMLVSPALAIQGAFITQQGQANWMLAISQLCITGHLLGKVFVPQEYFLLEFLVVILFYWIGHYFSKRHQLDDIGLLSIFISFMAINYQLISFIPILESHLTSTLYGDIATLSNQDAYFLSVLAFTYLVLNLKFLSIRLRSLIDLIHYQVETSNLKTVLLNTFIHAFLVFSLLKLGFLFVLAFLLLPSQFLRNSSKSLNSFLLGGVIISILSSSLGLLGSLNWTRLSTMPTQISILLLLGLTIKAYSWVSKKIPKRL